MKLDGLTSTEIVEHASSYHGAFYKQFLNPGAVVWDVGAYRGVMSFLFKRDGYFVVAIEGSRNNFDILQRNFTVEFEVGCYQEVACRFAAVSDSEYTSLTKFNDCNEHQQQLTNYVTLDYLLDKLPDPKLIKMDIEGMETVAMKAATRLINEIKPIWQISSHEGLDIKYDGYPGFVSIEDGGFDFRTMSPMYRFINCKTGEEVETIRGWGEFFAIPSEMLEVAE